MLLKQQFEGRLEQMQTSLAPEAALNWASANQVHLARCETDRSPGHSAGGDPEHEQLVGRAIRSRQRLVLLRRLYRQERTVIPTRHSRRDRANDRG
jgi:hypothetical protein